MRRIWRTRLQIIYLIQFKKIERELDKIQKLNKSAMKQSFFVGKIQLYNKSETKC